MNATQVELGPVEFGLWIPIPNAAKFYGVPGRTLRRWAGEGRLRTQERKEIDGVKGSLVWSEEVATLVVMQRDTQGGRLPKTVVAIPN